MKNPVVTLVEKEMAAFRELQLAYPTLLPENISLYPIPFFGDIRRAEVVTLALNPSHKEFNPDRQWPVGHGAAALTPLGLTNRLLSYFHLQRTPRHPWFNKCEEGLAALHYSYETNAAHIDVHPFPTKFVADLAPAEKDTLGKIVLAKSTDHMAAVLALCKQVKLIIVIEFAIPGMAGMTTFSFVRERLSALTGLVDAAGCEPPLLNGGGHRGIAGFLLHHQIRLTTFLRAAPSLILSP